MKMFRLTFIIFIFLVTTLAAQELPFRNYTTADGLSQSQVSKIHQDQLGYIWISTYNGLNRYDGVSFSHFNFYEHVIRAIFEDSAGRIWLATSTNGLYYLPVSNPDESLVKNINRTHGLNSNTILAIQEDQAHNIWLATAEQGLDYLQFISRDSFTVTHITEKNGLISNSGSSLLIDVEGQVWYGGTGISRLTKTPQGWHISNYSSGEGIPSAIVYMIYQSADSTIWCTTTEGTFYYVPASDRFLPLRDVDQKPIRTDTRAICIDSQGDLWLGTNGNGIYHGTYILSEKGWKFQNYTTQNGLAGNRVFTVLEDREHNLWFGTWGNGISKLVHHGFINFTWANGQPIHSVYGLFQDHQKNIWFGTDGRGALLFQDGQYKNFNISSGLKSNSVWNITSDRAQNVWFCTLNGLACFRPKTGNFRHFSSRNGLPRDNILSVHEDRQGHFWLGTSSYGILIYQHNLLNYGPQSQSDTKHFLGNHAVYAIYETRAGAIWLGSTNGACLFKEIPPAISQLSAPALKLLENIFVWCIFEDEWDRIWFGTNGNGLINFTGDSLRRFTKNDGLCDNTVYFIQPDNQKNCWLGTNRGIQKIQLTPDSLIILQNYDSQAGLASNETNVNCSILDDRNRLWFGTVEGVSQFVLEESTAASVPPLIYIKSVRDLERPLPLTNGMILNYKQNYLTFSYLGLSFKNETDIRYQHFLEGFDTQWSEITHQRQVQYTQLAPQNYVFHVRAITSDGVWSVSDAALTFTIKPPWWETWWAQSGGVLLVLLVIYLVYRFRVLQMKRSHRNLELRVKQRTQELVESEQRYRTLIEASDDFIFTLDQQGRFHTLNQTLQRRFGIASEIIVGKTTLNFIMPDSAPIMQNHIQKALKGEGGTFEWSFILNSVERIVMETTLSPLRDARGDIFGVVGIGRDITERIRMKKDLETERDKLKTILEAMEDMVMILTPDFKIIYINRAFAKIFPEIHCGGSWQDFWQTDVEGSATENNPLGAAYNFRLPPEYWDEKHKIWLNSIYCPIELPEGSCHLFILRDITERQKLEQERLNAERLAAVTQTAIAYNHEINNPLFGIVGYLEIMMQEEQDPKRYEELNLIYDAAQRIAEVTKRLRRLTRPVIRDYVDKVKMLDLTVPV